MQAKQYLQELKRLDTCINHKLQEKQAMYTSTIGAVRTDRERVKTPAGADALPNLIARMEALEKEIDLQVDYYIRLKHRIIGQIHRLSNETYVALLHMRYVEFKRLEEIAVEMNYAFDYVKKLHGWALRAFGIAWEDAIAAYEKDILEMSPFPDVK